MFIICHLILLLTITWASWPHSTGGWSRLWGQGFHVPNPLLLLWSLASRTPILLSVWAPHRGLSRYTRRCGRGIAACGTPSALCWSPVREGTFVTLAGLTWPHVSIPATMSSLQYRHGAPPRHGAMCRGPPSGGFLSGWWVYPSLASTFPAHYCPTTRSCVVFCTP